jgi:hypothetical protein
MTIHIAARPPRPPSEYAASTIHRKGRPVGSGNGLNHASRPAPKVMSATSDRSQTSLRPCSIEVQMVVMGSGRCMTLCLLWASRAVLERILYVLRMQAALSAVLGKRSLVATILLTSDDGSFAVDLQGKLTQALKVRVRHESNGFSQAASDALPPPQHLNTPHSGRHLVLRAVLLRGDVAEVRPRHRKLVLVTRKNRKT